MDDIARTAIAQSPVWGTILILGLQALQIWKEDLRANRARKDNLEKRLEFIEVKLGITVPAEVIGVPM